MGFHFNAPMTFHYMCMWVMWGYKSYRMMGEGSSRAYSLGVNDNNREITLSDNNLHIKPTAAIGFTVCLLL